MQEKHENEILLRVLALETRQGHLKWKVSDLARAAKVSRPLIYYHFGRSKQEILETCLELLAESYFGFTVERQKMLREGRLLECLLETRNIYCSHPDLAVFYQRWSMVPSPLQSKLRAIETRYQAKLKRAFPGLTSLRAEALHGIFHGLVTAPFLSEKALAEAVKAIQGWLPKK